MMQIPCPFCGERDETEFSYGGEAHIARPPADTDDESWSAYLYFRNNVKGPHAERWRHTNGCGQSFHAIRDTSTHRFIAVYRLDSTPPALPGEPL